MEILYDSLIKSSLGREDVAKLEKESVANSHEIRQTFRNASKAYYSYKYRTSVELIVGIALTGFFSFFSNIRGLGEVIHMYFDTFHNNVIIKLTTCVSKFCIYESTNFFHQIFFVLS